MPPIAYRLERSNPQGDKQIVRKEKIVVGGVVGMMRSFQ
jgi:hypothetical protein